MRELTLIRHGITGWNQQRILQGHQDVPLSPEGCWQAEQLALRMAGEPLPDALYSSDLARARQTAEYIVAARSFELRITPALRERSFGIYEGRSWDEVDVLLRESRLRPTDDTDGEAPPGGESRRQVEQRLVAFLEQLERAHPDGRVWVVSHGGVIRTLLRRLLGQAAASLVHGAQIPNASISTLRRVGTEWTAARLNCVLHLDGAGFPDTTPGPADESLVEERSHDI